jgi:hypothetical protein
MFVKNIQKILKFIIIVKIILPCKGEMSERQRGALFYL